MAGGLRIGVNALFLLPGGVGGTEIYLRNLLAALSEIDSQNRYSIFVNVETAAARQPLSPEAANFEQVTCPMRARNRTVRLLWEQAVLPFQMAAKRLDVLFSPGFTSPLLTLACPKVTVIHDLQHVRQPHNFGSVERAAWRASVWTSAHFSKRVVTVSESSRRDVLDVYGIDAARVVAIPHGVERAFFELREDDSRIAASDASAVRRISEPYLLSVSTLHPHKNWGRWLEAYAKLAADGFPHHLVIAGLHGKYSAELSRLIAAKNLDQRVHMTGWLERPALLSLFRFAEALVFPSTFEGFGMPVLEAMAAGVPVACSDIPPLREAAGEAAVFFDAQSEYSIFRAVRTLLCDANLRYRLIERGRLRAAAFTWPRAAEQTLSVLQEAAA
jgi:glycosyltransferase involved in cell wall biosynthesis